MSPKGGLNVTVTYGICVATSFSVMMAGHLRHEVFHKKFWSPGLDLHVRLANFRLLLGRLLQEDFI